MADETRFEIRLAEALGRLAELAPTMDDADVARAAIAADRSRGRTGWLASLRRPRAGLVPVLIALGLLLAALLAAIVVGAFRDDPALPLGRNGVIAFTVQDNDHGPAVTHLIEANGTADRVIEAERCPTYSTDGSVLAWLSYAGSASLVVAAADGITDPHRPAGRRCHDDGAVRPVPGRVAGRMGQASDLRLLGRHSRDRAVGGGGRGRCGESRGAGVDRSRTKPTTPRSGHPMAVISRSSAS